VSRSGSSVRLLGSVVVVVLIALLIAAGATVGLGFLLFGWHFWNEPVPRPAGDASLTDPVKIALTIVAGIGGVVALVVAYRKQAMAERVENRDRYGAAVTQLGNPDPTVRLAGVYAMANLADEWKAQRQQCVDVLCAYLRMPWDPEAESQHRLAVRTVETQTESETTTLAYRDPHGESQVRATILRMIADHLRTSGDYAPATGWDDPFRPRPWGGAWSRLSFDLTGASLVDVDLSGAVMRGERVLFERVTFHGSAAFDSVTMSGRRTSFSGATFGSASFDSATFSGESTKFLGTSFSGDKASFRMASFGSGETVFDRASFSGLSASFELARFRKTSSFEWVSFSRRVSSSFDGTRFSTTSFNEATFVGQVTGRAQFDGSRSQIFGNADIASEVLDTWVFSEPDPVTPVDGGGSEPVEEGIVRSSE
jgi:uncharacterized protein YjbI with pentapeptide repeats